MSTDNGSNGGIALDDIKADRLRDVAYSADVDTDGATKKAELVERLHEADVAFGPDGWTKDGEQFDVEERPSGSSGPSDTTLLYGFTREATTDDFMDALEELAEERGLELRTGETESGKETVKIVEPAEATED